MHIVKQGGYLGKEAGRRKERRREETRKGGESGETAAASGHPCSPWSPRTPACVPPGIAPDSCKQLVMKLSDVDLHQPLLRFVWAPTLQTQQNPQGWGTALGILNQHPGSEGLPTRPVTCWEGSGGKCCDCVSSPRRSTCFPPQSRPTALGD